MGKTDSNPRRLALRLCLQVVEQGQSLTELLRQYLPSLASDRDRAFCSELCYGLCRYYFVLSSELQRLMKKPLKSRDSDVHMTLLLGLYQLRFTRVSNHAAVNESVRMLKSLRKGWAGGLANAVLRSYIRGQDGNAVTPALNVQEQRLAYPPWMVERIEHDWPQLAETVFRAGNERAPMTLRVDTARLSREQYVDKCSQQGIAAEPHRCVDSALLLTRPLAVEQLPGFAEAEVSVQDAAAQLAAPLLACEPGMAVLDACAAPGGKTLHLLQATTGLRLTALDKDSARLERVAQNLQRASVDARLVQADAAETESWFEGQPFDRILLDAPCSASGIMRRHPDIRLLRREQDIESLAGQQRRLLDALWPLLKPGGILLYSTCSLFQEENELQILDFMKSQELCAEVPINEVQCGEKRPVGLQILPGSEQMDGFYYARLLKQTAGG